MNVAAAAKPHQPEFTLSGDPKSGTRVSGYFEWKLHVGIPVRGGFATVDQARHAASILSKGEAPTVAIVADGSTYSIAPAQLQVVQHKDPGWTLAPEFEQATSFDLATAMKQVLTGGGIQSPPAGPLVGLVDGHEAAHIVNSGPLFFGWGFDEGLPAR